MIIGSDLYRTLDPHHVQPEKIRKMLRRKHKQSRKSFVVCFLLFLYLSSYLIFHFISFYCVASLVCVRQQYTASFPKE